MTLYDRLITEIFRRHQGSTTDEFEFERDELNDIATEWGERIKNLGDVIYTYRVHRRDLPEEITATGNWVIESRGKGTYAFKRVSRSPYIACPMDLQVIPILDATPDIILRYGGTDEQGLLAKVRYNRLIDIFLGLTAYHLQGHVRSTTEDGGQVEIDDLYLGVDTDGQRYVIPVEAKTAEESLGIFQVINLNQFGREKYPELVLRSVAVKACDDNSIFCIQFNTALTFDDIEVVEYKRYRLIRDEVIAKQLGVDLERLNEH